LSGADPRLVILTTDFRHARSYRPVFLIPNFHVDGTLGDEQLENRIAIATLAQLLL
jgi:hypothetical protein